jgi:excinuclease ABC subunit A
VLHSLADKGNTVIVIEHNLDVVKTADWIIDMGPEGGSGGGTVVAEGTPEQIAADRHSHTGAFLAGILEPPAAKPRRTTAAARAGTRQSSAPARGTGRKRAARPA